MPSYKKAIELHCKSCGYDPLSGLGGWRQQINDCPCTSCCLYEVRPKITVKQTLSQREKVLSSENEVTACK